MARIILDDVSMIFRVREKYQITLKEYLLRRMYRPANNPLVEVRALQNVSFHVGAGERVGIIGSNGSGKSTMLKLLAGVYAPTSGQRLVEGRVSSLFELSLGFEMEATGWQNIIYRGYLQGETPASIRGKMQEIAKFSELGRFLNLPVRYYSAGMLVRLAFSIATAIEPEILLVDEVLSAGDMAFQAKARQRLGEMMAKAQIIVVVSHDLGSLPGLCDKGVWLEQGRVQAVGPIRDIIAAYTDHVRDCQLQAA